MSIMLIIIGSLLLFLPSWALAEIFFSQAERLDKIILAISFSLSFNSIAALYLVYAGHSDFLLPSTAAIIIIIAAVSGITSIRNKSVDN